ncbi:hypothetical protein DFQ28_007209 [Apophysomyces sp. BC1034]|nr:hypothetical protein DFQ29_006045 [Apophysomyces sp. BC1021]KAG0186848.1 hypothetical protein DFQ28_007209 [Apophysomyces sp. BC1034]
MAARKDTWQLDLLSAAMVCRSWYFVSISLIKTDELFDLVNFAGAQRAYPHRRRLAGLLEESKRCGLGFHRLVHKLVIDLISFQKEMVLARAPSSVHRLVTSCPSLQRLEIVYDAKFASMPCLIVDRLGLLTDLIGHGAIDRLDLVSHDPVRRCPCCAGRGWDHLLCGLLERLPIRTLALHQVIPSQAVFDTLSRNAELHHLVLHRSIQDMPGKPGRSTTSLTRIPRSFFDRIDTLDIYEDLEDAAVEWPALRYFSEMADRLGPLQSFTFECTGNPAKEKEPEYAQGLLLLAEQRSKTLRRMTLRNVPGITSKIVKLLLGHIDHLQVDSVQYDAYIN